MIVVIACRECGTDPIKLSNTPNNQDYIASVHNGDMCQVADTYRDAGRYFYLVNCSSGAYGWIEGKYLDLR
jgi:hypothetical protein